MNSKRAAQLILLAGILLLKTWAKDTVRLVGPIAREGRVEVYHSEAWGVVCGEFWDIKDANVVCRMLGYGGALAFQQNITFEQENDTVWLSHVQCTGNETSLSQCGHSGWGKQVCNASQAAGVACFERGWDISSVIPHFISSTMDTITISCDMPSVTLVTYKVQIWSKATRKWRDTRCAHDSVNGSCVVTKSCSNITVTDLIPGHAYNFRFVSPSLETSQVSREMLTKKLGYPTALRFVSSSNSSITLTWESTTSDPTNYSVEMRCCKENTWREANCKESLFGQGCTVSRTTATVTGLKQDKVYFFRVYAVYKNRKSAASGSSKGTSIKSGETDYPKGKIWITSLGPECITSRIGQTLTLYCHVAGEKNTVYKWTKGDRTVINDSRDGVLSVTTASATDFGVYTCHVITSEGHAVYNISVCRQSNPVVTRKDIQDPMNSIVIAIITTCFICFGLFIIVLILLKMAQIHRRRKKQEKESGREEMAMLNYRQKSFRGNNNEEELELNS